MKAKASKGTTVNAAAAKGKAHGSNSVQERLTTVSRGNLGAKPSDFHGTAFRPSIHPFRPIVLVRSLWDPCHKKGC